MYFRCGIILLSASVCILSCSKTTVAGEEGDACGLPVDFGVTALDTKGIITPDSFTTPGNAVKVNDIYTSPDGGKTHYISGTEEDGQEVTYGSDGKWSYSPLVFWTQNGKHEFLAYTYAVADSGSRIVSLDDIMKTGGGAFWYDSGLPANETAPDTGQEGQSFNIDSWKLTPQSQFDFMYSSSERDIDADRRVGENPFRAVGLQFRHLFAAVCVKVRNINSAVEKVTVDKVWFEGLHDTGSARILYGQEPEIQLQESSSSEEQPSKEQFSVSLGTKGELGYNGTCNVYSGEGRIGDDGYFLIWPHEMDDFEYVTLNIGYVAGNKPQTKTLDIGSDEYDVRRWQGGQRYTYTLNVSDTNISFSVSVVPWIDDDVILE